MSLGQQQKDEELQLNKADLTLKDILHTGNFLEKTLVEITHTKKGEIINITQLEEQSIPEAINNVSTTSNKSLWMQIVEIFFDEIAHEGIPEKMRRNMLIVEESVTCLQVKMKDIFVCFVEHPI